MQQRELLQGVGRQTESKILPRPVHGVLPVFDDAVCAFIPALPVEWVLPEIPRNPRLDGDPGAAPHEAIPRTITRERWLQLDLVCMEQLSARSCDRSEPSVYPVADNREADRLKMLPDLMCPARLNQFTQDEGKGPTSFQNGEIGDRKFRDPVSSADDRRVDADLVPRRIQDDREVPFVSRDFLPVWIRQILEICLVTSDQENPGRETIDPMGESCARDEGLRKFDHHRALVFRAEFRHVIELTEHSSSFVDDGDPVHRRPNDVDFLTRSVWFDFHLNPRFYKDCSTFRFAHST